MWKLTTLLSTLAVGASSLATAQTYETPPPTLRTPPARTPHEPGYDRTIVVDRGDEHTWYRDVEEDRHRYSEPWYGDEGYERDQYERGYERDWRYRYGMRDDFGPRRYRTAWVSLTAPMQLYRGREIIRVDDPGTFTQLRVQATNGATFVDRVIVTFLDGSRQHVRVTRWLDPRRPRVDIPLQGNNRRIDHVTVIGGARGYGAIQVFGI